jgi:hypothetical protein
VPVLVSGTPHATALGVAALARLALGEADDGVAAGVETTVLPSISKDISSERMVAFTAALQAAQPGGSA